MKFISYIYWSILVGMYLPVFSQLYRFRWANIDYTHAYFILPMSVWLTWRKRAALAEVIKRNTGTLTAGLILFLFGASLFIFGRHWDYLFVSTISLVPVLIGTVSYLYGWKAARMIMFPVLYLLLLVPPPLGVLDSITLPMRFGISYAVDNALNLFGIPFTREGLMFIVDGHKVYMGAPCSGFRSLITMFSLALVYAYVINGSPMKKVLLVLSVIPLALLGNFIRVLGVCLMVYYFSEKTANVFHDISGYAVFLLLLLALFWLDGLIERLEAWQKNR
jgi:exosortase